MGGSSRSFFGRSTEDVTKLLKQSVEQARDADFEGQIAEELGSLLAKFNGRDTAQTAERLDRIKELLGDVLGGTVDTLFGGSVSKHTFVDGISDVDSLLILDRTDLANESPGAAMSLVTDHLMKELSGVAQVRGGTIAVTVTYPDSTELQLVPTIRVNGVLHVPAWEGNRWSAIDPQQFRDGLTKRNMECGGKVIPTIKLAKAVCANLPQELRPSGYHLESLAVAAFRGYEGDKNVLRMLPYFFERAKSLVLNPMKDRSGQSVHVDESLGEANSSARVQLSFALDRLYRRMTLATGSKSRERWMELFNG